MIRLSHGEWREVSDYVHSLCAISLDQSKAYLIESRLYGMLRELGCSSYTELINRSRLDSTGGVARRIIDNITTGETLFFRDNSPFDLLKFKVIPELIDRRSRMSAKVPLRVWSAACSTGQEIYSIAILLKEMLGDAGRYALRLLGTDISDQAVTRASIGIFSETEIGRGLPEPLLRRYFTHYPGGWRVNDEIRAMTSFRRSNLLEDLSSLGKFDIVFCRNVAIYFNDRDKALLFSRIEQRMERDGYLFIGSTESLTSVSPQFEPVRHLRSVYYQLKSGDRSKILDKMPSFGGT